MVPKNIKRKKKNRVKTSRGIKRSCMNPNKMLKTLFYFATSITAIVFILSFYLFAINSISIIKAEVYSSITFSLLLSSSVFAYLLYKKQNIHSILLELGLSKDNISKKIFSYGIILFFIIFALEILISLFSYISGIALPTNVSEVLFGTPLYFLLFSILIAPINEEIFFRGFLVPKYGIILPALLFALLHAGYGSIVEGIGAFVFGVLAGYIFKKTKSLYPSIIAHVLVNGLAITSLLLLIIIK
ncbi:MAG: CPBP family intramembrane glutamic endopeptidase [Candidatus Micrarchaeia archaeon]